MDKVKTFWEWKCPEDEILEIRIPKIDWIEKEGISEADNNIEGKPAPSVHKSTIHGLQVTIFIRRSEMIISAHKPRNQIPRDSLLFALK